MTWISAGEVKISPLTENVYIFVFERQFNFLSIVFRQQAVSV
jgi:hypothetical protein